MSKIRKIVLKFQKYAFRVKNEFKLKNASSIYSYIVLKNKEQYIEIEIYINLKYVYVAQ